MNWVNKEAAFEGCALKEEGRRMEGGKKTKSKTEKQRVKDTARISPQRKCILVKYTEGEFEL